MPVGWQLCKWASMYPMSPVELILIALENLLVFVQEYVLLTSQQ